jgi:conjugal transfer pilus assembly protein TraI
MRPIIIGAMLSFRTENKSNQAPCDPSLRFEDTRYVLNDEVDQKIHSVLKDVHDRIVNIKSGSQLRDEPFSDLFIRPLACVSRYFLGVPADRTHHTGQNGLFKLALDSAFFCYRSAGSRTFEGDKPPDVRRNLELKWGYAAYLAGMLYPLGKIIQELRVYNIDDENQVWSPLASDLPYWIKMHDVKSYGINWDICDEIDNFGKYSIIFSQRIIPHYCYDYIGDEEIIRTMFNVISGVVKPEEHPLATIVLKHYDEITVVNDKEVLTKSISMGISIEHFVVDILRQLTHSKWKINSDGYPVYNLKQGVFLNWLKAGKTLQEQLVEKLHISLPDSLYTLAEVLIEKDIAEPFVYNGQEHSLWPVIISEKGVQDHVVKMLKLKKKHLLFNTNLHGIQDAYVGEEVIELREQARNVSAQEEGERPESGVESNVSRDKQTEANVHSQKDSSEAKPVNPQQQKQSNQPARSEQIPATQQATSAENSPHPKIAQSTNKEVTAQNTTVSKKLRKYGAPGSMIEAIALDLKKGKWMCGKDIRWGSSSIGIRYPDVIGRYGIDAKTMHKKLAELCWLDERGNDKGIRKYKHKGKEYRYIFVIERIGKMLESIYGQRIINDVQPAAQKEGLA